ncbi:hypothetical protein DV737_g3, partial [Chaetothyriales sp. CBS 132003]
MPPSIVPSEVKQALGKFKNLLPTAYEQTYLYGFRGFLVIQTFLWMFLQTFVPVAVAGSSNSNGRLYQEMLRKTLSVLFWNENLLYGTIIFLSGRCLAIPFLRKPSKAILARSMMTRGITLWFPVAVALAIVKIASNTMGQNYIYLFRKATGNHSMSVPYYIPNAFAYFNCVFNLFWVTRNFSTQAGSTAFPTQTLWMINVLYSQSYTVYITMIIIPYTRPKWRVQAAIFFVITAWWVQSWAWFTITGLLVCDMVMNMDWKDKAQRGIPLRLPTGGPGNRGAREIRVPVWIPAVFCIVMGLLMQFLWTAWRPDLLDAEYFVHTDIYNTGGLNYDYKESHTMARADNYLYVVGLFILLETYDVILSKEGIDRFDKRDRSVSVDSLIRRNLPQNISNDKNAIRGVNLGGLFVIENWLENDVFAGWGCNSSSEFDCVASLSNQSKANSLFQQHWDSWITQDDFTKMVSYGLNTVRIPVGYWFLESIVDSSETFPQGGASYLDRVIGWARDAGMYVIISLHGAPGAQVTNAFTGQLNPDPGFYDEYNYNRSYVWLEWMTKRVHQNAAYSTVGMLELVNEPERLWETSKYPDAVSHANSMRKTYYPTAWARIRDTESSLSVASDAQLSILMMHKSWGSGDPTQYLSSDIQMAAFDRHIYTPWAGLAERQDAYISFICNETSTQSDNTSHPVFWTWKTTGSLNDPRWDYQKAVAAGLIDTNIDSAYSLDISQIRLSAPSVADKHRLYHGSISIMPKLVRRAPLSDRISAYFNPYDFLLWLSEEIDSQGWSQLEKEWALPLGIGLNLLFLIARANSGTESQGYDDVFGDSRRARWVAWLATFVVHLLSLVSLVNAVYTFWRKKHYRLFESSIDDVPSTPSARRVRVDSSPVASSPLRFLSSIVGSESAQARAHPDAARDVWEVTVWDPLPLSLRLFCYFSPGHVLIYWLFLPTVPADPRPSIRIATAVFLALLFSLQLSLLQAHFSQQGKDAAFISKEVLHEYDTKYVRPRTQPLYRDVATQFSEQASYMSARDQRYNVVEAYTPAVVINRGFRTNPNPNYSQHTNADGVDSDALHHRTPAFATPTSSRPAMSPTRPLAVIRQPNFRPTPQGGGGGSLGVYTHAASPLRKAASTNFAAKGYMNENDRYRSSLSPEKRPTSPTKRLSMPAEDWAAQRLKDLRGPHRRERNATVKQKAAIDDFRSQAERSVYEEIDQAGNVRHTSMIRSVSEEDYLLVRGANPRTGLVTPGIHNAGSINDDPDHTRANTMERPSKWRQRGNQWISFDLDQPTPVDSQSNIEAHSHTPNTLGTSGLILRDKHPPCLPMNNGPYPLNLRATSKIPASESQQAPHSYGQDGPRVDETAPHRSVLRTRSHPAWTLQPLRLQPRVNTSMHVPGSHKPLEPQLMDRLSAARHPETVPWKMPPQGPRALSIPQVNAIQELERTTPMDSQTPSSSTGMRTPPRRIVTVVKEGIGTQTPASGKGVIPRPQDMTPPMSRPSDLQGLMRRCTWCNNGFITDPQPSTEHTVAEEVTSLHTTSDACSQLTIPGAFPHQHT